MGQAQLSVTNLQNDSVAAQAGVSYQSRGVPTNWYVDPADPGAAAFHERENRQALEDAATAFLTSHEDDEPVVAHPAGVEGVDNEPVWIGLNPQLEDFSDEGELGWQTDALCAQTDPEAFFPEKGGSTRDAKKFVAPATSRRSALNTLWPMMSGLESGVACRSESAGGCGSERSNS